MGSEAERDYGGNWRTRDIEERGSPELKEILFLITQGHKPGFPVTKETAKNGRIEE